jgi:hypothetical protein
MSVTVILVLSGEVCKVASLQLVSSSIFLSFRHFSTSAFQFSSYSALQIQLFLSFTSPVLFSPFLFNSFSLQFSSFSDHLLFCSSALRHFSFSALHLFISSALQLFSSSTLQLFSAPALQLSSSSALQLFISSALQLSSSSALQLFSS